MKVLIPFYSLYGHVYGMAQAIAEDRFSGSYKRKALEDNLNYVCDRITFTGQVNQISFLKVA